MYHLTKENLEISFDGHLWIKTNRQKTDTESNIRLLEVARHILKCSDTAASAQRKFMRRLQRRRSAVIWRSCRNRLSRWNHLSVKQFNYTT